MTYKLVIAEQVARDLNDIEFYMSGLGTYNSSTEEFLNHVYDRMESLEEFPFLGEELSSKTVVPTNIRYLIVDEYLIFYEVFLTEIFIYRVLSQRQDYIQILKINKS